MLQHQDVAQSNPNGQLHGQTTSSLGKQYADGQALEKLVSNLRGELILPGDPAYEAERKVWNGLYDYYPAAIARCADAEDVRAAVNFAREQAMTLSVRSGGHSLTGYVIDGMLTYRILRRNRHYHHVARIAIRSPQKMSGSCCA